MVEVKPSLIAVLTRLKPEDHEHGRGSSYYLNEENRSTLMLIQAKQNQALRPG